MLSDEEVQLVYDHMPSTITVDGHAFDVERTFNALSVVEYTKPTVALQLTNEFNLFYKSIEEGYTEIDEDTFTLSKDYTSLLIVTVVADDTEPISKSVTFEYQGSAIPDEPYIQITSVVPATPVVGQNVTVTFTRIIRGFDIVRAILKYIEDLMTFGFPVSVVSRSSAKDISRLIGRESLTANQISAILKTQYVSTHTVPDINIPIEEVEITCNL